LFTLHSTQNIAYHITEELIFYADKPMVMGSSKNLRVFNFVILLKSLKFDTREIYMFYGNHTQSQLQYDLYIALLKALDSGSVDRIK